ncbi:MAG TPA: hypothetical protein VHE79_08385, partial [Spirochaetia bacterium]
MATMPCRSGRGCSGGAPACPRGAAGTGSTDRAGGAIPVPVDRGAGRSCAVCPVAFSAGAPDDIGVAGATVG